MPPLVGPVSVPQRYVNVVTRSSGSVIVSGSPSRVYVSSVVAASAVPAASA